MGELATYRFLMGQSDEALKMAKAGLMRDPSARWLWERCLDWAEEINALNVVMALLERLSDERPGDAQLCLLQALLVIREDRWLEALKHLESALERDPALEEAHDQKIHCLVALQRFEEADKASTPSLYTADKTPLSLRGRRAWVKHQRGDVQGALSDMLELTRANCGYEWGWQRAFEWAQETGNHSAAEEAAEWLVRLRPHDPESLVWRSIIFVRKAEEAERRDPKARIAALEQAHQDLNRAFGLNPSDESVARRLFRLLLMLKDPEAAQVVLQTVDPYLPDNGVRESLQVRLAVVVGDKQAIDQAINALLSREQVDAGVAFEALRDVQQSGVRSLWRRFVRRLHRSSRNHPPALGLTQAAVHLLDASALQTLIKILKGHALHGSLPAQHGWAAAVDRYLNVLVPKSESTFGLSAVRRFCSRNERHMRAWCNKETGEPLSAACWALLTMGHEVDCLRLLGNWRNIKGFEFWVYHNLLQSAYGIRRDDEAFAVIDYAIKNIAPDHTHQRFQVLRCLLLLQHKRMDEAFEVMDKIEPRLLDNEAKHFYRFARVATLACQGERKEAKRVFGKSGDGRIILPMQPHGAAKLRARKFAKRCLRRGRP